MHKADKIIKIILIILFLICLIDLPYEYYQLIRFLGMVGFGILAFKNYSHQETWYVIWLSSAILINPIFKIYLGRDLWKLIDIVWVVLLTVSLVKYDRKTIKK